MVEIEHAIRDGVHGWLSAPAPTVEEYWTTTYRPTYTIAKRAPRMDDQMMAHALPVLGSLRLDAVTTSDCVRFLNIRRASLRANPGHKTAVTISEGSVQRIRGFLQGFFQRAVDDGIIERNPWKTIERKAYAVRDRLLTAQEQAALLPRLSPEFQRMVRVLLGTGLRLDELRGIDPVEDLLLDERQIIVRERTNEHGELITRVKGGKQRVVPIPVDIVDDFQQQLMERTRLWTQSQARLRQVLNAACKARAGAPARTSKRGQIVAAVEARAAIAPISPHALRHTFGWRFLKGGGDIYTLSKILGDTVAVTERHYAHLLKEDVREKADRVDLGLARPGAKGKVIAWAGSQK
jgi:integrase